MTWDQVAAVAIITICVVVTLAIIAAGLGRAARDDDAPTPPPRLCPLCGRRPIDPGTHGGGHTCRYCIPERTP